MSNRKKWTITIALLVIGGVLYALGYHSYDCCLPQPAVVNGGSCAYDSVMEPAKIVYARKGSTHVIIRVAVKGSDGWADTLQLDRNPPYKMLTLQDYEASGIREGDSIFCKHLAITSGDCTPDIYSFDWKKFTSRLPGNAKNQPAGH